MNDSTFREHLWFPLIVTTVGTIIALVITLAAIFWQYDIAKQHGVEETESRIQPTINALETKTAYLGVTNFYVEASQHPFDSTGIQVNRGDQVNITIIGQNKTWDCSNGGEINAAGFEQGQHKDLWIEPGANFCELLGRIGQEGPYLRLGTQPDFIAQESGTLHLGANDMWPHHCPEPNNCFADNKGRLFVKIQTTEFRR